MSVTVDAEECLGCGACACASACSESFEMKDGTPRVKNQNADCVDSAMSACPVGSISKQ